MEPGGLGGDQLAGSAAWELSDAILRIDRSVDYPVHIHAAEGRSVLLSQDADTLRPIPFGLVWPDGHAVLAGVVAPSPGGVSRTIARVTRGTLRAGMMAHLHSHVFDGDPRTARELDYGEPVIQGELGGFPAWQVPPGGAPRQPDTWVIAVHGRGAGRQEALRILPTLSGAGVTSLVISYRNDVGAPPSPDGLCHLGEDEWRDVAAAIRHAQDQGAGRVVLYGWSMGALLALTALRRLPPEQAAMVGGLILDSPLVAWRAALAWQARQRGIPPPLARKAAQLAERRAGLSLAALDGVGHARWLTVPALIFADTADLTVPVGSTLRWVRAHSHLISLLTTSSGHGRSWNEDPARYQEAVRAFLDTCASAVRADFHPRARGGRSGAASG